MNKDAIEVGSCQGFDKFVSLEPSWKAHPQTHPDHRPLRPLKLNGTLRALYSEHSKFWTIHNIGFSIAHLVKTMIKISIFSHIFVTFQESHLLASKMLTQTCTVLRSCWKIIYCISVSFHSTAYKLIDLFVYNKLMCFSYSSLIGTASFFSLSIGKESHLWTIVQPGVRFWQERYECTGLSGSFPAIFSQSHRHTRATPSDLQHQLFAYTAWPCDLTRGGQVG